MLFIHLIAIDLTFFKVHIGDFELQLVVTRLQVVVTKLQVVTTKLVSSLKKCI